MKTTLDLPDDLHFQMKSLALDHRTTVTQLIRDAIEKAYCFTGNGGVSNKPFARLEGMWKGHSSSEAEIKALKMIWNPRDEDSGRRL